MDFVWKLYGNMYAVHVTVALVGVVTLNLALPAPLKNKVSDADALVTRAGTLVWGWRPRFQGPRN